MVLAETQIISGYPRQGLVDGVLDASSLVLEGREQSVSVDLLTRSRHFWEETFAETAELPSSAFQMLPTGIGRAPGDNRETEVKYFADGSRVTSYKDLRAHFGYVPQVLFLTGSPLNAEDIVGLVGLCHEYKRQGVQMIVPILTATPHERQDHKFKSTDGQDMRQTVTLRSAIRGIAGWHPERDERGNVHFQKSADALIVVQPHSAHILEYGLEEGIPILPLDALGLLYNAADLRSIPKPFVIGPDKGRKTQADILAEFLDCPKANASKVRNRRGDGQPTVTIPDDALAFIRDNGCIPIIGDDEVREGGTIGELAIGLADSAKNGMIVCTPKFICAGKAVARLSHPTVTRIITTDAIHPVTDMSLIKGKLAVVKLQPEIERVVFYLSDGHMVDPGNPNWLQSCYTGTLLHLDPSIGEE